MNCSFKLTRKIETISKVIVKEPKIEMVEYRNDVDFVTTINPTKQIDLPILAETDIFRALQLLPGISFAENSSELNIRGGSNDQNLVLYDGQTLYNLNHCYGVFSSLNPNIIKDIQVYKGGYDSRYGERVSGIVDITSKSGNQLKPTIYGDLNLVSGNIAAEIPLTKKLTIVVAGRRSYSDIYATQFADNLISKNINPTFNDQGRIVTTSKPSYYFYDYNSKLSYKLNQKEDISISIYGGKDYYNSTDSVKDRNHFISALNQDKNTWGNYGISATWLKQWNGAYFSNFQFVTSGYNNNYSGSTDTTHFNSIQKKFPGNLNKNNLFNQYNLADPGKLNNFNYYNQNTLSDNSVSLRNIYYLNNNNQLNFGILFRRNDIYYHNVIVENSADTMTWLSGFETAVKSDDIFYKSGSGSSSVNDTLKFSHVISKPLLYDNSCGYIKSCIITLTRLTDIITFDYGDGTCDSKASVITNGTIETIDLSSFRFNDNGLFDNHGPRNHHGHGPGGDKFGF